MQKFAKFHPLTPTFGGSIPGGWAGVFRHKTLEKRIKCSCDSVTCSKPSAKRENMGVWGHSPQEKFAVSNVCVVSFAERVVASLRQHGVRCGCLSRVPARRSSSVRRRRVRPPTRTIGSSRRVSGRRPPRPEGVARAPAVTRVRTRPSAPCNEVSNTKCRFLLFCQQVLPLFTDRF